MTIPSPTKPSTFTREDIKVLLWPFYNTPDLPPEIGAGLLSIADRIETLLPPEGVEEYEPELTPASMKEIRLRRTQREDDEERERARPANAVYTGNPCENCGRIRVYLRKDGQLQCEKCETIFPALASTKPSTFEELVAEISKAREILASGLDRDRDPRDTLVGLASVAINGIYWRGVEIEKLRANALTEWEIAEILGCGPESGRPGYLRHHPDCTPPRDCQCNLFGIQNRLNGLRRSISSKRVEG